MTWINVEGEHINLAAATSIAEVELKGGLTGYKIFHGGKYTTVAVCSSNTKLLPKQLARWGELLAVIVKIEGFLAQQEAAAT